MLDVMKRVNQFRRDGYLVLEDFFDAKLMDRYQGLIEAQMGARPEFFHNQEFLDKAATEVVPWFPQREGFDAFDTAGGDADLERLTEALLGPGWTAHYAMVMLSKAGTRGQAWHQDCPPEHPLRYNLNRLIYTHDIDPQVGGQTIVLPGSHRMGELSAGDPHEDLEGQVVLTPRKGTLVLLHGHTWHRVTPVTRGTRISTNYRCGPAGTPEDITDICVYRTMRYQFSTNQVLVERAL